MKKFFKKIQEFFVHLFGGVTKTEAREKLFEVETKCSSQYDELCDKYTQLNDEFEKYKKDYTHIEYLTEYKVIGIEPKTFESFIDLPSFAQIDDDAIYKQLVLKLIDNEEFKKCVKIYKEYSPLTDSNKYKIKIIMGI